MPNNPTIEKRIEEAIHGNWRALDGSIIASSREVVGIVDRLTTLYHQLLQEERREAYEEALTHIEGLALLGQPIKFPSGYKRVVFLPHPQE